MTTNPLAKATLDIPCPDCGKQTTKPLRQLIGKNSITCSRCDARIDINAKYWRTLIRERIETAQKGKS